MPDAPDLPIKHVVSCFLVRDSRILLLKRSQRVRTFKGKWAAVSGFAEGNADRQSLVEIQEETGLYPRDVSQIRSGNAVEILDTPNHTRWVVHPYLFQIVSDKSIRLDWEHDEFRWLSPSELAGFDTVPGLVEALNSILPI